MKSEKIILGIDPGTTIMGFGLIKVVDKKMQFMQLNELMLKKYDDPYVKLKLIFERTVELIDTYHPDEMAIEAPFFGKNVQSMLKLGRAQGVAMAAGLSREIPVTEYLPKKIKKLALLHTMIYRIKQNSFTVIDSFNLDTHKSKDFAAKLDLLKLSKKILIISDHENNNLELSSRNIKNVKLIKSVGVNVYDLLNHKSIIIDKITFNNLIERIK